MKYTFTLTALGEVQGRKVVNEPGTLSDLRRHEVATELYNQFVRGLRRLTVYPAAVLQVKSSGTYTYMRPSSNSPFSHWVMEVYVVYLVFIDTVDNKAKVIPYNHGDVGDEVANSIADRRHPTRVFAHQGFSQFDADAFASEINDSLEWDLQGTNDGKFAIIPTYIVLLKAHHPDRFATEINTRRPVCDWGPTNGVSLESFKTYEDAQKALAEIVG